MATEPKSSQGASTSKTFKSSVYIEKWGMNVDKSIVALLEKIDNGDLSELSDLSDCDDETLLSQAEIMEDNLLNLSNGRNDTDEVNEEQVEEEDYGGRIEADEELIEDEREEQIEDEQPTEECREQMEQDIENVTVTGQINRRVEDKTKITEKSRIKWTRKNILEFDTGEWHPPDEPSLTEDDILSPVEYFSRYITPDIVNKFVEKTNIYALQYESARFKPTNKKEIESFIGLHLLMGCLRFPRISMYWENSFGLTTFKEAMSRNRFYKLRSNLHLVNNLEKDPNNTDKFYKVRPIYESLRKRCLDLNCEQKVCVDEQMCPFKGKHSTKQYMKDKPKPWGIKFYFLCGESGIFYDFFIYQGKSTEVPENLQKKYGQGAACVVHLSSRIKIPYTEMFFDNYFTSYGLLQCLKSRNILAAGTARINRFANPPFLQDKQISKKERGYIEELFSSDHDVVILKWLDNRVVSMASNFIGKGQVDKVKRWDKSLKEYVVVPRPEVIQKYNTSMGGVDKLDFLMGIYRVFIRSRKWPLRLIFHAIDLAICNSWLEYKRDCEKANVDKRNILDLLHFKLEVANSLVKCGQIAADRKRGRPSRDHSPSPVPVARRKNFEVRPLSSVRLDTVDHLPVHNGQKESARCKNPGCSGKSHFKCEKCNIHLCLSKQKNCFKSFHVK